MNISISLVLIQRRRWHSTPVLLPGKSHGWRGLVGCSPWGRQESDTTERLHFHSSLPCIGEGNGNPLQCSCLENPRDGGAWWAGVYGVTQSRTRLKWLSSSGSSAYSLECDVYFKNHLQIIFRVFWCCSTPSSREGPSPPCYLSTPQLSYPLNQMYKPNFKNIWVFLSWWHTVHSEFPRSSTIKNR